MNISAVQKAKSPTFGTVHLEFLLEVKPPEVKGAVTAPSDHATVQDWSGEPGAIAAQRSQGKLIDAVEKPAINGSECVGRSGQFGKEAQPLLPAFFG